ncbi:Ig domain protein group 2 domain protein [Paenibacillus sp. MMS18-CY102]|nr:Ig domain protein group 2 domain protein [Paenibacillus sp. MMS18-CY102]MWC29793.1 Ig domain protein group 2 domain protein [Paenibacillus sp. MMS18-CY102]
MKKMTDKKNWKRKVGVHLLACTLFVGSIGIPGSAAFAEGPSDPAPVLQPVGAANGKKVLFDNTHGQTAGAADWVIDGAFSDYAQALANQGYYVKELRKTAPITLSDLTGYDVFIIGEANIPYKTSEQAALLQYAQNGGSIFFIADHYNADRNKNRWDSSEVFNGYRRGAWSNPAQGMGTEEAGSAAMQDVVSSDWLGTNFGVRFRYNAIGDVTANNIVAPSQAFGITQGVSTVAMHAGSTLAIMDPQKAKGIVYLPATSTKWSSAVDQGVYEGGGVNEGPYVAVSKVGLGKAAFIGDSSPVEDATPKYKREETGASKTTYAGFTEQNDGTLLVNIANWLSVQESYTSLGAVSGLTLDQPTSLLAMENPATSTEPQAEPWAAPAAGYKWWDRCTFKTGSYGAGSCFTNSAPTVANPITDRTFMQGSSAIIIDAASTFSDANGDALTLSAASSNSGVATVSVSGKQLTVTPIGVGTASITVTANDGNGGTVNDVFTVTVSSSTSVTSLSEYFESGTKGAYAAANVTLSSGSWMFNNALIGNLSTDKKSGTQSARINAAGYIQMNFDVAAAQAIKLSVANFNNDSGTTWKLQKSTNAGTTWTDVTAAVAATSVLTEQTIAVNEAGPVRFKIVVAGTSGKRINVDDFAVLN